MSYRRSPAATSISLPSFNSAFRSPSPNSSYPNHSANHSNQMPSHARTDSRGAVGGERPSSGNQLPPLRYMNSGDPRDIREGREEIRRQDSGEGRKRPHEDLEREGGRNQREEEAPVKPEPLSPPGSPYPKRARPNSISSAPQQHQRLSPNNSAHSSSTGPQQAPISPVVAGFAIDPERPVIAMDQVRRSLGLKQQQQEIIQRRKEQAEGARSDREREWLDQHTNSSPHLSQHNAMGLQRSPALSQQRSPGQQPQQPPQSQQRTLPPPTLAARRGPLTASKAASLTIQTTSSGSGSPAYTSSHSRETGETHTLHPHHAYGRPLIGHPTSALRGGVEGFGEVRSAPPQQTRFALPPIGQRPEAARMPSQLAADRSGRPIMSISQTSREMQRERVQDLSTPRDHRAPISSVPLSRSAQRTPSVLRPVQRDREPSPPMTGSTTAVSAISRRQTFDRQSGSQGVSAGHHYPFGGAQGGAPMQTAPLPGRTDILQQQQAAAAASHGRGLPGQYPPPTAGLPPPTAGTSAAAAAAAAQGGSTTNTSNLDNLTPEQRTFLYPFLTFYDSILDSQKLKEWLKKEIERAGRANQSLMDNHHAIERLIGNAVKGVREEFSREREEWERRVATLEKRVRELEGRGMNSTPVIAEKQPATNEKGKESEANGMQVDEPLTEGIRRADL
ncbi:hypothetical protein CALVIDRAFT_566335 [Calocera viscosa TUFC12733]|uniref:Uncharacterized protein n=1 Tax=Calocera viscosa (strain TUFC12733) TaxID=1330018 RepID=A0A167JHH6_CALVF|nr:hypothetical protein CALVIDRAFT_566335 [Calocera viscosa TUFC12733]